MARIGAWLFWSTLAAGIVGVARQRREAVAVRRGELTRPSAAADIAVSRPQPAWAQRLGEWVPQRPRTPLGRALAWVWSAPLTAAGLVLTVLAGARPRWEPELGCFVVRGAGGPSRLALTAVGAHANTVGLIVLSRRDDPDPVLLAHEAVHVRQSERLGPLLLPVYVWLAARFGYRDHPLERSARRGAAAFRQAQHR